jgi:hypothetical protein
VHYIAPATISLASEPAVVSISISSVTTTDTQKLQIVKNIAFNISRE